MIRVVFAAAKCDKPNIGRNYLFGYKSGLPWNHIKEDLQSFKKSTEDCVLYMGSDTFRSLPGILPGRKHVVISRKIKDVKDISAKDGSHPHEVKSMSWTDLAGLASESKVNCFIGGIQILYIALEYANEIIYTEINPSEIKKEVRDDANSAIYLPREIEQEISYMKQFTRKEVTVLSDKATVYKFTPLSRV